MKRRFLHGRSYGQMLEDGDLPKDPNERLAVIIIESYIRGTEQAAIVLVPVTIAILAFLWWSVSK